MVSTLSRSGGQSQPRAGARTPAPPGSQPSERASPAVSPWWAGTQSPLCSPLTWKAWPCRRSASGCFWPPSLLFVGSQERGHLSGGSQCSRALLSQRWLPFIRLSRSARASAQAGFALHPPPVKSPSGPLSTESWLIKPLAKEFGEARSSRTQHPPR